MRPIDSNPQFDPTSGAATSDPNPANSPAPPVGPVIDQPVQPPDSGAASLKRMERDLESSYLKGTLDNAGARPGGQVLYDKNKKPDGDSGTETAGPVHTAAPLTVADNGDDELNMDVRAAAGHLVGKKVVGDGECYALADAVLRGAGAKSAPDFGKVTKSRDQDYKWGTPIDAKDAKPGDILQFRNHQVVIETVTKTTVTKDGHSTTTTKKETEEHDRGQHTAIVLSNDGGKMLVAEQHVKDPDHAGKLSSTVRKNVLDTQNSTSTSVKSRDENGAHIKVETTKTITVTGNIYAYRPQPKDDKK